MGQAIRKALDEAVYPVPPKGTVRDKLDRKDHNSSSSRMRDPSSMPVVPRECGDLSSTPVLLADAGIHPRCPSSSRMRDPSSLPVVLANAGFHPNARRPLADAGIHPHCPSSSRMRDPSSMAVVLANARIHPKARRPRGCGDPSSMAQWPSSSRMRGSILFEIEPASAVLQKSDWL
jgi:hypothetical protein